MPGGAVLMFILCRYDVENGMKEQLRPSRILGLPPSQLGCERRHWRGLAHGGWKRTPVSPSGTSRTWRDPESPLRAGPCPGRDVRDGRHLPARRAARGRRELHYPEGTARRCRLPPPPPAAKHPGTCSPRPPEV